MTVFPYRLSRAGVIMTPAPGDLLEIHLQDGIVPAQVSPPERGA